MNHETKSRRPLAGSLLAHEAKLRGDVEQLLELVNHTDYWARIAATRHLGELREPRAIPLLKRNIGARDDGLRMASVKALGAIGGDGEATQLIYECGLTDEDFWVRCMAAEALAAQSDPRAIEVFVILIDETTKHSTSGTRHFRKFALRQIEKLDGVAALAALERAAEHVSLTERWRFRRTVKRLSNRVERL